MMMADWLGLVPRTSRLLIVGFDADHTVAVAGPGVDAFYARCDDGAAEAIEVEIAHQSFVVVVQGFDDLLERE